MIDNGWFDPVLSEKAFRIDATSRHGFVSKFGRDRDVQEITLMLVERWIRTAEESARIRMACQLGESRMLMDELEDYVRFHGPHLWASLGTEAGVRASVQWRQPARGSYRTDT